MEYKTKEKKQDSGKKWIKILWGAMPVLFLVLIIIALGYGIKFRTERLCENSKTIRRDSVIDYK